MQLTKFGIPLVIVALALLGVGLMPESGNTVKDNRKTVETSEEVSIAPMPKERPIAFVRRYKPMVRKMNRAEGLFKEVDKAEQLYDGDTLATGDEGYAAVQFMDKSLAKVKPNSLLLVNGSVDNETKSASNRIMLNAGELLLDVVDQTRSDFEVSTSTSVATVKGTNFGASVEETGSSYFYVLEGSIDVTATESGNKETLDKGMYARVDETGEDIETGELDEGEIKEKEEEFQEIDQQMKQKKLKFRFRNDSGELQEIELYYYEKNKQE